MRLGACMYVLCSTSKCISSMPCLDRAEMSGLVYIINAPCIIYDHHLFSLIIQHIMPYNPKCPMYLLLYM